MMNACSFSGIKSARKGGEAGKRGALICNTEMADRSQELDCREVTCG